jgi:hypothetical protein
MVLHAMVWADRSGGYRLLAQWEEAFGIKPPQVHASYLYTGSHLHYEVAVLVVHCQEKTTMKRDVLYE